MPEGPEALAAAAAALSGGALVVIPTDTVYGVGTRLDMPDRMAKLFEVKQRPRSKPLAVLVADLEAATELGSFEEEALRRAEEGWPGALTLVVPCKQPMPALGGDGTTIGLRVPDRDWTRKLLRRTGPLAVTSANPSGRPTGVTIHDVVADLGERVDLYVDGGPLDAAPSTVVSLLGGEPRRLR